MDSNADEDESILQFQSTSHYRSQAIKLIHTWTIDHFNYHFNKELNDCLYIESSKFFPFKFNEEKLRFFLRLYPRGGENGSKDNTEFVSIYLHLDSADVDKVKTKIKIYILDSNNSPVNIKETEQELMKAGSWGWPDFISHSKLKDTSALRVPQYLSLKNKFTICCEINVLKTLLSVSCQENLLNAFSLMNFENFPGPKNSNIYSQSWTRTLLKIEKLSHLWTIDNFSLLDLNDKNNSSITSQVFYTPQISHLQMFQIMLSSNGETEEHKNHVGLYLYFLGDTKNPKTSFKFSIIDSSGNKYNTKEIHHIFSEICGYGPPKFIQRNLIFKPNSKLLIDDKLKIYCEIEIIGNTEMQNSSTILLNENRQRLMNLSKENLSSNLYKILQDKSFSDVILVAGEKEFRAHKVILAAQSPVFAKMFEHPLEESKNNRVDIIDIEPEIIEKLLQFIYISMSADMDEQLFEAADKYQLDTLKQICVDSLCAKLSSNNVFDLLVLGEMHNSKKLKLKAIEFIKSETSMLSKEKLQMIQKEHQDLFNEVLWKITNIEECSIENVDTLNWLDCSTNENTNEIDNQIHFSVDSPNCE